MFAQIWDYMNLVTHLLHCIVKGSFHSQYEEDEQFCEYLQDRFEKMWNCPLFPFKDWSLHVGYKAIYCAIFMLII